MGWGNASRRRVAWQGLLASSVIALTMAPGCGRDANRDGARAVASARLEVKGASIVVSPAPLDFGPVVNGATKALTIRNDGTGALALASVAFCAGTATSPEFVLAAPATPLTLAPGASTIVNVTYTVADFSATDRGCITVVSDDPKSPSIDVALSADGITYAQARSCAACHGNASQLPIPQPAWTMPAPPRPPYASYTAPTTDIRVGAHHEHIRSTRATSPLLAKPIYCNQCHPYPPATNHATDTITFAFGSLATHDGSLSPVVTFSAQIDPATGHPVSATCSNVYCHGATLAGGTNTAPIWNKVDGSQAACGSCHGLPPPHPHPQGTTGAPFDCGGCHGDGYTATSVNPETHVNGSVEFKGGACTACHGDPNRANADIAPAPPLDTSANQSSPAVGAHQAHLTGTALRQAPVQCTDCHPYPPVGTHPSGTTDFAWSALAVKDVPNPGFDEATGTCAVYCHGATLSGGTVTRPAWAIVNGTQAACGACHGIPPVDVPPHSAGLAFCDGCHPDGYSPTSVDKTTHIDGKVDAAGGCTACHGDPNRTPAYIAPAPPVDTKKNSSTTAPGVGAHEAHLLGRTYSDGVACTDCHVYPTDTTHITGKVELPFGALTKTGNVGPVFVDGTCANTYCHGATLRGGTDTRPAWTEQAPYACNGCHGIPPDTGLHLRYHGDISCGSCHPGYDVTAANPALHVNGVKDVQLPNGGIWDPVKQSCGTACHGPKQWDGATTPAGAAGAVASITTSSPTSSKLTVSWSAATNAQWYELQRDTTSTFASPNLVATTVGRVTSTDATGLAASTRYYFRVRALSSTSTPGSYSPTGSGTTQAAGWTPYGPVISATPNPLAFGTVITYLSQTLTVTVRNSGNTTLFVSSISRCAGTSTEFRMWSNGFTIAPGVTAKFNVTYAPIDWSVDTGCIKLANNDPAHNPYIVNVSGMGE